MAPLLSILYNTAIDRALHRRPLLERTDRLASSLKTRWFTPRAEDTADFRCNLCGHLNRSIPLPQITNRECQSCTRCRSSLRMRSLVNILSMELFGEPRLLKDFPTDKSISGVGMSDWDGFARTLAERLSYTNTYYHAEPPSTSRTFRSPRSAASVPDLERRFETHPHLFDRD